VTNDTCTKNSKRAAVCFSVFSQMILESTELIVNLQNLQDVYMWMLRPNSFTQCGLALHRTFIGFLCARDV